MSRKLFLTIAGLIASGIGSIALFAPMILLVDMKQAIANDIGLVMARTAGAFLLPLGIMSLLIRNHDDSPTMVSVLFANACLQILILPVDPLAYISGAYGSIASFLPNTILHILLLLGFIHFWWTARGRSVVTN